MGYWSDSLQYTQVIYDHHYLTITQFKNATKVVQKWDIPFNVWGAVLSRPGPAALLTPLWKPPKKFSAYAPVTVIELMWPMKLCLYVFFGRANRKLNCYLHYQLCFVCLCVCTCLCMCAHACVCVCVCAHVACTSCVYVCVCVYACTYRVHVLCVCIMCSCNTQHSIST